MAEDANINPNPPSCAAPGSAIKCYAARCRHKAQYELYIQGRWEPRCGVHSWRNRFFRRTLPNDRTQRRRATEPKIQTGRATRRPLK
jgi:hypothetical protein